jgi:hypothetical protein
MKTNIESWQYPASGAYNETVAVLADGRKINVCVQYKNICIEGAHLDACTQRKMGGQCDCPYNADIMADKGEILQAAKGNGFHGRAPMSMPVVDPDPEIPDTAGKYICPKCETFCWGDCEAE